MEDILQHCAENPAFACAYFFFDNRSAHSELSLHHGLIRSLILQLSEQCGHLPGPLVQLYGTGNHQPSIASLQLALRSIFDCFERTYIIIDALDECTDRAKLLAWAAELFSWGKRKLHILLSSRPERDIEERFTLAKHMVHVALEGHMVDGDIADYLDVMLRTMPRWNQETYSRVKDALLGGAEGM